MKTYAHDTLLDRFTRHDLAQMSQLERRQAEQRTIEKTRIKREGTYAERAALKMANNGYGVREIADSTGIPEHQARRIVLGSSMSGVSHSRKATADDRIIGQNIRRLRKIKNVSSFRLAEKIGVSPQTLHKYEMSEIRISASRLGALASVLKVSPSCFFEVDHDDM